MFYAQDDNWRNRFRFLLVFYRQAGRILTMRITSCCRAIAFFVVLGVCLVLLAVGLNVGWIIQSDRQQHQANAQHDEEGDGPAAASDAHGRILPLDE